MVFIKLKTKSSLVIQWFSVHASVAGGTGLIPGWENKVPHAAWRGQINKWNVSQIVACPSVQTLQWISSHSNKSKSLLCSGWSGALGSLVYPWSLSLSLLSHHVQRHTPYCCSLNTQCPLPPQGTWSYFCLKCSHPNLGNHSLHSQLSSSHALLFSIPIQTLWHYGITFSGLLVVCLPQLECKLHVGRAFVFFTGLSPALKTVPGFIVDTQ